MTSREPEDFLMGRTLRAVSRECTCLISKAPSSVYPLQVMERQVAPSLIPVHLAWNWNESHPRLILFTFARSWEDIPFRFVLWYVNNTPLCKKLERGLREWLYASRKAPSLFAKIRW